MAKDQVIQHRQDNGKYLIRFRQISSSKAAKSCSLPLPAIANARGMLTSSIIRKLPHPSSRISSSAWLNNWSEKMPLMAKQCKIWSRCSTSNELKSLSTMLACNFSNNSKLPPPTSVKQDKMAQIWRFSQRCNLIFSANMASSTRLKTSECLSSKPTHPGRIWQQTSARWKAVISRDRISSSQTLPRWWSFSSITPKDHMTFDRPCPLQEIIWSEIKSRTSWYALFVPFIALSLSFCKIALSLWFFLTILAIIWSAVMLFTKDFWSFHDW